MEQHKKKKTETSQDYRRADRTKYTEQKRARVQEENEQENRVKKHLVQLTFKRIQYYYYYWRRILTETLGVQNMPATTPTTNDNKNNVNITTNSSTTTTINAITNCT